VRERAGKDIWQGLFEFILLEHDEPLEDRYLHTLSHWGIKTTKLKKEMLGLSEEIVHQLSHQKIHCRILRVNIDQQIDLEGYQWKSKTAIRQLPFPRLITRYLGW
jgi:A/G-specific adenine glycosylase